VLREQLGEKVIAQAGAEFDHAEVRHGGEGESDAPRVKKPVKPPVKSALIADRKGSQRAGGSAPAATRRGARNEEEANGYGPPARPKRGYHGKRDLRPRDAE